MNIVLIGYRGSGKTSIGRQLAAALRKDFIDTDSLIVQQAGKTITEMFATDGEPAFREIERAVIRATSEKENVIIAIGGGTLEFPENLANLKRTGKLVWLSADPEILFARIHADAASAATRPNLLGGGIDEVRTLLARRTPNYQAGADLTLDVGRLSVEEAVEQLMRLL